MSAESRVIESLDNILKALDGIQEIVDDLRRKCSETEDAHKP